MIFLSLLLIFQLVQYTVGLSLFAKAPISVPVSNPQNDSSPSEPKMIVSFVNGIYHTLDDWTRIANQLKETFNAEVRPFYNPSTGYWVIDASAAGYELLRRSNDFIKAKELSNHLRDLLNEVGPEGRVLHIAHSGGAILTYLAAKYHLSNSERNQIDVITFGAGHSITHRYFKGYVRNYYAKNDPVMNVDRQAMKLWRQIASFPSVQVSPRIRVFESEHNTSYYFLTGLTGNPMKDHSMEEPTYRHVLNEEAKDFELRKQKLGSGVNQRRRRTWNRSLRKRIAGMTGWHHFWNHVPSKPGRVLKDYAKLTATIPAVIVTYPDSNSQIAAPFLRKTRKALAQWTGWHKVWSKGTSDIGMVNSSVNASGAVNTNNTVKTSAVNIDVQVDRSERVPTLIIRDNSTDKDTTLSQVSATITEGMENLSFFYHSESTQLMLQRLNDGTKQLLRWAEPARQYVATSLVTDVSNGLSAVASVWPGLILPKNETRSSVHSITHAAGAATEVDKDFDYNVTMVEIELPPQLKLLLLTSAQKICARQYNTSSRVYTSNRHHMEEDLMRKWQRTANLAKLLAASEGSINQKVVFVSCALKDCWSLESSEHHDLGFSQGVNKTLRAVVPSFLTLEEASQVLSILHRLNASCTNTTDARNTRESGETMCVLDAMHLTSVSSLDILNKQILNVSASTTADLDSMLEHWQSALYTEGAKLLMKQRMNLLKASLKEQYLEDLLGSQSWEVDVE